MKKFEKKEGIRILNSFIKNLEKKTEKKSREKLDRVLRIFYNIPYVSFTRYQVSLIRVSPPVPCTYPLFNNYSLWPPYPVPLYLLREGVIFIKGSPKKIRTLYPVPCTLYPVPCTRYPVPGTPVPCTPSG